MKNKHFSAITCFILAVIFASSIVFNASAGHIGDFYRDLYVTINCDACEPDEEREVTIQLFADGEPVEDGSRTLNKEIGFRTTFYDLPIFRGEKTPEEIEYDVRVNENGKWTILPVINKSFHKEEIAEWVSVNPEDLQAGHEYAFLTENWNYENNEQGKYVLLNEHVELSQTSPDALYRMIEGNKSYYYLEEEPAESDIWTLTNIAADDPDYALYPNTHVLTNREGKRLVLSQFDKEDWIDTIWRYSGKNGYNESEKSLNTNKLSFIPEPENRGRFRIAAATNYDGVMQDQFYVGVNHFYAIQAQTEPEYAAQFLAFEYVEKEALYMDRMDVEYNLCDAKNPNTIDMTSIYGAVAVVSLVGIIFVIRKNTR